MTINEMEQIAKILRDDIFERLPNELVYFIVKNRNSNDYDLDQITEEFYNEHTNFWSINPMLGEILKERGADIIEVLGLTIWGRKQKDGNALIKKSVFEKSSDWFREVFGSGGEDRDFFKRKIAGGFNFIWCNEAIVYECIPAKRWSLNNQLKGP